MYIYKYFKVVYYLVSHIKKIILCEITDSRNIQAKISFNFQHNLTNFGLVAQKKEMWRGENQRKAVTSLYKDAFLPPHKDCYEFPRWGRPK